MTTRRSFLTLVCGAYAGAATAQLAPNIALLRRQALQNAVDKIVGGATVRRGRVKLDVCLAKGKKQYDKRATIKEREWNREQQRLLRNRTGAARTARTR